MPVIVVTGANGYVASHLVQKFITDRYKVIALVRKDDHNSAQQRMVHQLQLIDPESELNISHFKVFEYILTEKNFGMNHHTLEEVFNEPVEFFHFAASLKYHERNQEEIFRTNVNGCENALEVFHQFSKPGSRFFYISTAYSCGLMSGVFQEQFYPDATVSAFRNLYEQSKRYAENVVARYIKEKNLNACVIRLAQIIGDSASGETLTSYGVFDFAKRMAQIAHKYPNQTVRIRIDPDGHQNLVPIDHVLDYFKHVVAIRQLPQVIHFVSRENTKNSTIISCLRRFIPIRIHQDQNLDLNNITPLERLISGAMSFTGAYTTTRLALSFKNLDQLMGSGKHRLTDDMLCRMLGNFIYDLKNKSRVSVPIKQPR